jgi:hypothetical protein
MTAALPPALEVVISPAGNRQCCLALTPLSDDRTQGTRVMAPGRSASAPIVSAWTPPCRNVIQPDTAAKLAAARARPG